MTSLISGLLLYKVQMFPTSKSIAFWGAEAPPYGGMTVHIKRLNLFLRKNEWTVIQYNFEPESRTEPYIKNVPSVLKWYLGLWGGNSPKIHYVITTRAHIRFLATLLRLRGKKIIIRVGGESMKNQIKGGGFSMLFNIVSLKYCSAFIGVNHDITSLAEKYTRKEKVHLIPGFIPPQFEKKAAPYNIMQFFDIKGLKIVVTGQVFGEESPDIYGLFHFVNALKLLSKNFKFKVVMVIYGSTNPNFHNNLKRLEDCVKQIELADNVLIYVSDDEFWPIIKESDIFVRPSITDGDANAIREALFYNKHVIASDCVPRPEPCYLYKNLDSEELAKAIQEVDRLKKKKNKEVGNQVLIEKLLLKLID